LAFFARGVRKTWFALSLAVADATGTKFLKWNAGRPRSVLFVEGEFETASLQQRLKLLEAHDAEKLKLLCCDRLEDPFPSALAPSSNESEGEDWIAIQKCLFDLARRGMASIFLHHAGHSG
jgi:hypothetical protein